MSEKLGKLLGLCTVAGVLLAGMFFPVVGGLGLLSNRADDNVGTVSADLAGGQLPVVTTVTDSAGTPIAYLFDQYRVPVAAGAISAAMKAAIVASEDKRFYQHGGVDPQGIVRALVHNGGGGAQQGGSTLTQQYVKNYNLYTAKSQAQRIMATAPSYARKLTEARVAIVLDQQLSKDEILARYLNIVYLGNGSYGVGAAARSYFGTTAGQLSVPQAALLAGMVQNPSAFDPVRHPTAATGRRNEVIALMQQQGMITAAQAAGASAAPLGLVGSPGPVPEGCLGAGDAGYFCSYVVDYLAKAGISPDVLNKSGYTIRTTLDRGALAQVKAAVDAQVPPRTPHVAEVMSVIAPGSTRHRVLAMAANRTFGLDAAQYQSSVGLPYQPENLGAGSVYKIFTAAAAMEKGLGIDTVIDVPPSGYTSPIFVNENGAPVPVHNAGTYAGQLSLQDALAQSPNTAFVKLEEYTGVDAVVDMALRLGMTSLSTTPASDRAGAPSIAEVTKSQNLASFTLGDTPTSALELANVDATLASHGIWCPPSPIEQVTDSAGRPVPITEAPCTQAVAPQLADTLLTGMSKDDQPGGTSAAAAVGWNRPVAGKTGTTQQQESAAFVATTPQLAGAVIAFDDSPAPGPICDGAPPYSCMTGNIFGGKTPARTWYQAMAQILAGQPVLPLPPSDPRYLDGGQITEIPDVVGETVDTATADLRQAGFRVATTTVDNRAPKGTVLGENPVGTSVAGQTVTLDISTGQVPPPPAAPGPAPPTGG